jgi:hypothetical protein
MLLMRAKRWRRDPAADGVPCGGELVDDGYAGTASCTNERCISVGRGAMKAGSPVVANQVSERGHIAVDTQRAAVEREAHLSHVYLPQQLPCRGRGDESLGKPQGHASAPELETKPLHFTNI